MKLKEKVWKVAKYTLLSAIGLGCSFYVYTAWYTHELNSLRQLQKVREIDERQKAVCKMYEELYGNGNGTDTNRDGVVSVREWLDYYDPTKLRTCPQIRSFNPCDPKERSDPILRRDLENLEKVVQDYESKRNKK